MQQDLIDETDRGPDEQEAAVIYTVYIGPLLPDNENKVMVLERHRDVVVADRKSIEGIGYEERLHDYYDNGAPASIEGDLNKAIETPFSQSRTWLKICGGNCADLDETDRLPLYGFARHLQLRNLGTLRFIEMQQARYLTGELEDELTDEERDMHAWIAWTRRRA